MAATPWSLPGRTVLRLSTVISFLEREGADPKRDCTSFVSLTLAALDGATSRKLISLAVLIATLVGVLMVSPRVRHEVAISFSRQPDVFTELYFEGVRSQLVDKVSGQSRVEVSFTVAKHGGASEETYICIVQALTSDGSVAAELSKPLVVPRGNRRTAKVRLDLAPPGNYTSVAVELAGYSERIHSRGSSGTLEAGR